MQHMLSKSTHAQVRGALYLNVLDVMGWHMCDGGCTPYAHSSAERQSKTECVLLTQAKHACSRCVPMP
jgi:hypothetical protein